MANSVSRINYLKIKRKRPVNCDVTQLTDVLIGEQGVGSKNGGWLDVERQGVMGIINNSESQTYVLEHFPKISEDV